MPPVTPARCSVLLLLGLAAALALQKRGGAEARGTPSARQPEPVGPGAAGESWGTHVWGDMRTGVPVQTATHPGGARQPEGLAEKRAPGNAPPGEASLPGMWPSGGGLWQRCGSWALKTGLVGVLGLLVVAGNGLVVAVAASSVSGWSHSSRLVLLSLAAADAALAVLVVPLNLSRGLALGPGPAEAVAEQESSYCRAVAFLNSSVFGASLYSLAGVSLERYVAVFFPLRYHRLLSRRRVALLIAASWLVPALVLVPLALPAPAAVLRVRFSAAALLCEPDYGSNAAYSLLIVGTLFCPAAATITFTNVCLWRAARAQRRRDARVGALRGRGPGPRRRRLLPLDAAARVLLPVVVGFYVCWAPCITILLYNSLTQRRVHEWVEFVALWLPTGSGFLNCFVYFWINRNFRRRFQKVGRRLCCPGRREQGQPGPVSCCHVAGGGGVLPALLPGCSSSFSSSNCPLPVLEDSAQL
ncbi:D(4) dopamine receptor-like [Varanus komodoensis]|uniref:D(4) dopamine receptor-like n=1 Tax=Varanus komodoensis TaxID=61221 RepID=UPI001CF7C24F|nr:D(4) dopamine receptor-like [Varanus komodoensis]